MNTTSTTSAEIARIEELLSRLDPDPAGVCRVPGCLHLHVGHGDGAGATVLAA